MSLTLRELHADLERRGVEINYGVLSKLLGMPRVAELLRVAGTAQRRQIPDDAADVLAAFLPEFKRLGFKWPQAEAALASFLKPANPDAGEGGGAGGVSLVPQFRGTHDPTGQEEGGHNAVVLDRALALALARVEGHAAQDCAFTAQEAAEFLRISVRQLRKTVKPWRRFGSSPRGDRWRLSDLLADAPAPS